MHKLLCGSARRVVLKTSVFDGRQQCVRRPSTTLLTAANNAADGRHTMTYTAERGIRQPVIVRRKYRNGLTLSVERAP